MQFQTVQADGFAQGIAGGTGDIGDDGTVAAGQRVEQRALAGVGRADDHRMHAVAQLAPAFGIGDQRVQLLPRFGQAQADLFAAERVEGFVGEVDGGFHVHAQRQQRLADAVDARGEHALQRAPRGACGACIGGRDEIGDGFGLGEIELAVEESAFGELPRPCHPRTERAGARHQLLQHDRTAVRLQFHHVFPGETRRAGKRQRDAIVDRAAVGIQELYVVRTARRQRARADRLRDRLRAGSGQAHDADASRTGSRGDGRDGVLRWRHVPGFDEEVSA